MSVPEVNASGLRKKLGFPERGEIRFNNFREKGVYSLNKEFPERKILLGLGPI